MSCVGPLSPLMTIAGAGMLPGAGAIAGLGASLGVSAGLVNTIGSFLSVPVVNQFTDIVAGSGALSSVVRNSLTSLGADIFPAITNAIPSSFVSALAGITSGGLGSSLSGVISSTAEGIMGAGDLGRFAQVFDAATGFAGQANQLLNSGLNINNIAATFSAKTGGMDSLITGSFSQVTEAFGAFGSDLQNLGSLIDMDNLPNLGSPAALVQQLSQVGGIVPAVEAALRTAGLDSSSLTNLAAANGFSNISDSANKLIYDGLTGITGTDLAQVKSVLGVTTPGINTMADLLDPTKILPNSFPALTMPTPDGLRGIYATTAGAVNTNLERFLVDPAAPVYTGDDAIVRARFGLPSTEATV